MKQFTITKKDAGQRFDKYLKKLLPEASAGFIYKMLRKKNITLNGKKAEGREIIEEQDEVSIFFSDETFQKFSGQAVPEKPYLMAFQKLRGIQVVYEDEDILILDKPAGVLSQKAEKDDISVNEWLLGYLLEKGEIDGESMKSFRPSVCNRLDRNTGGLMLCGKTLKGSRFLSEILRDRGLRKYYLAYAQGEITKKRALTGYLRKDEEKNRVDVLSENRYHQRISASPEKAGQYQKIETVIEPLVYLEKENCTKLKVLLITGKSHQIRAQLSAIGHPIIGDMKYGWKPGPGKTEDTGTSKKDAVKAMQQNNMLYQLLYAYLVEFPTIKGDFSYLSGKAFTAPGAADRAVTSSVPPDSGQNR